MILLNKNKPHLITLFVESSNKPLERFPNQLIWDINTFLEKNFCLYEFYFSDKEETEVAEKIPKFFFGENKFLCFEPLNSMYIKSPFYDEKECLQEYQKYKNEVANYNTFKDIYLMNPIDELNYFAIENFDQFFEKNFDKKVENLKNKKKVRAFVEKLCPVYVFIGDHDYMEIYCRDLNIQDSLIDIISKYLTM